MPNIGQWNTLPIIKNIQHGLILDGGDDLGEILMPNRYVYEGCEVGETADVFIYNDSEDRLVATTERPKGVVGEFAFLKCVDTNPVGAFMDWGMAKDLLVPFAEQHRKLEVGRSYIVYIFLDERSQRIAGSCKLNRHLSDTSESYHEDQEVDLLIAERTDLGYKAIVNHSDWGLLYHNEIFQELKVGQKQVGYVYAARPDGKLDISLHPPAEKKVAALTDRILEEMTLNGDLMITDKSPPQDIYDAFEVSKKTFKKALGSLYKAKKILIESDRIRLL